MFKKNVGSLDRIVRFVGGIALALIGVFLLGGWRGNGGGILVAVLALIPLVTGFVGFCPIYVPFGISTRKEK